MKVNIRFSISCCYRSQKLGELEKNGNSSYSIGEEGGTAQRDVMWQAVPASKNMAQRNVRDPSVYLFVNEENETGNLILGLCFPIVPIATERMPLEPRSGELPSDLVKSKGAASWAPLQLGRLARPASWVPCHAATATLLLCCSSNFMKKEGRSRTAGEGQLGQLLGGTWRLTEEEVGWWRWVEEKQSRNDERERKQNWAGAEL